MAEAQPGVADGSLRHRPRLPLQDVQRAAAVAPAWRPGVDLRHADPGSELTEATMKFLIPIACVLFVCICAVYLARRFFGGGDE
jgi:hypothetical protein